VNQQARASYDEAVANYRKTTLTAYQAGPCSTGAVLSVLWDTCRRCRHNSAKLYPKVDFYSGIIYSALGIPRSMFTVLFAIVAGWKVLSGREACISKNAIPTLSSIDNPGSTGAHTRQMHCLNRL
jgi:hypothetical protein